MVEVLATMALIAIVMPVLLEAISTATRSASDAKRRTEAAGLAESKLTELVTTGDWQNGAPLSGDFGTDFADYRWQASIQSWTQTGLEQIDLHVNWQARDGQREIVVTTLAYNGANSSSANTGTTGSTSSTGSGASAKSSGGGK